MSRQRQANAMLADGKAPVRLTRAGRASRHALLAKALHSLARRKPQLAHVGSSRARSFLYTSGDGFCPVLASRVGGQQAEALGEWLSASVASRGHGSAPTLVQITIGRLAKGVRSERDLGRA